MATDMHEAGEFCWINILTPRPAEAMDFFGPVLGWTFFEMPGLGHGMKVGGRDIGGLFDLDGPNSPPGLPPTIGVVVRVDDADRTVERVVALGGRARPAFAVGDRGRLAVCHDPAGAAFDVWEPVAPPGPAVDRSLAGAPSWSETLTTDPARATSFYADLFGWTPEPMELPGFTYTSFRHNGKPVAGLMPILPSMGTFPAHWGTYFTVADADETAAVARDLGATVFVPPADIPNIGRFCGIMSPQGVRFYAIRYLPRAEPA